MKSAILLGLRLATGTGAQRARTLSMATASGLGSVVLLGVWGIAHSQVGTTDEFTSNPQAVTLLVAGTIGMVALPVLVFIATIARLSARVRDRRLANLRLLGLSAPQTRLVAATEVGLASLAGTISGAALMLMTATLIAQFDAADRDWTVRSLIPPAYAWVVVVAIVPVIAVLTATLPQPRSSDSALSGVLRSDVRPVHLIRVTPLVLGFALCWATRSTLVDQGNTLPATEVFAILTGIALLAIGMLLVIPVFVTLMATLVLRLGRGPLSILIGRRLQTQPAGTTRVIAALMIGLFVVVAARGVLTAFLSTPQYQHAADFVERAQTAEVAATADEVSTTVGTLRSLEGVDEVTMFPVLMGTSSESTAEQEDTATVVVATCAELAGDSIRLPGCSDTGPSQVGSPWWVDPDVASMQVQPVSGWEPHGRGVPVPLGTVSTIDPRDFELAVGALTDTPVLVIPPSTPGIDGLLAGTDRLVVAHAGPGRFLYDRVAEAGLQWNTMVDLENYDFVQGMLTLVWTLATVIIAVGLLTFTIAGIDRALARRRELTALRLIGTPGRLLRIAQWWEAALPTVFGSLLAIWAGAYAGATYLQLDNDQVMPLTTALALGAAATATAVVLAGITTIGTTARLDPEHIRSE